MELYIPHIPQAVALLTWCACMVLVTLRKIDTWRSVWVMIAGSVTMTISCHMAGNVDTAPVCIWVGLCAQAISLLALECLNENGRVCATVFAEGIQVVLTMSMVAEASQTGMLACIDAFKLSSALFCFTLLAATFHKQVSIALMSKGGKWTILLAAVLTAFVMLRSLDRVVLIDLPVWGPISLTEASLAICAVALPLCTRLYVAPTDNAGIFDRLILPVTMVATTCCMCFLGDATTGIALAVAMALVAIAKGRSPVAMAGLLAMAVIAAVGLSLIVPNMANAWKIWSGTMSGSFAGLNQSQTVEALFSGDNPLLGCGVGRSSEAMWNAPHGVVWPLMISVSTFGALGLAALILVGACSLVAGIRVFRANDGGVALPFISTSMSIVILLGLLAAFGVLPDIGTHDSFAFLCLDATASKPMFTAIAISLALGCDAAVKQAVDPTDTATLTSADCGDSDS